MPSSSAFRMRLPRAWISGRGPSRRWPLWPAQSRPTPSISRVSAISWSSTTRPCFVAWAVARLVAQRGW
eukprot:14782027-Alexandrium_andersonii.AAC.1